MLKGDIKMGSLRSMRQEARPNLHSRIGTELASIIDNILAWSQYDVLCEQFKQSVIGYLPSGDSATTRELYNLLDWSYKNRYGTWEKFSVWDKQQVLQEMKTNGIIKQVLIVAEGNTRRSLRWVRV
jgi:hypothetical protein